MLTITRLETFVIGDGPEIDPDKGGIEPLACLRVHTDDGVTGFSEVFRVPPGVVQATVGGPETHFGRLRGALVCPGNWSTQILGAASVHLAAYSSITPFIEFAPAEVFDSPLRRDLQETGLPVKNAEIKFPEAPGIGFRFPDHLAVKYRAG